MIIARIYKTKTKQDIILMYLELGNSNTKFKRFDSVSEAIIYCDMVNYIIVPSLVYMIFNALKNSPNMWDYYLNKYEYDIKTERDRLIQNLKL